MASSNVAPNGIEIVDLPNLPIELFNMVVHQLVATDIRGAWMMRGIFKVFKNAVEDDILRHQPSDVVRNSGDLIKQLMPLHLYWRIKKPNDVHTALLVRLTKMNDYLCEELHITLDTERDENLQALCRGHVKMNGYHKTRDMLWALRSWYRDSLQEANKNEIGLQAKVAAAMSVRALPLLRKLLPQLDDFWFHDCRSAFDDESPLIAAASLEDNDVLQVILEQGLLSMTTERQHPEDVWAGLAIRAAIKTGSTAMALAIFNGILDAGFPDDSLKDFYDRVLGRTVETAGIDLNIIRGLLRRHPWGRKVSDEVYLKACATHNAELIQLLRHNL
jgi:hypothetical protein